MGRGGGRGPRARRCSRTSRVAGRPRGPPPGVGRVSARRTVGTPAVGMGSRLRRSEVALTPRRHANRADRLRRGSAPRGRVRSSGSLRALPSAREDRGLSRTCGGSGGGHLRPPGQRRRGTAPPLAPVAHESRSRPFGPVVLHRGMVVGEARTRRGVRDGPSPPLGRARPRAGVEDASRRSDGCRRRAPRRGASHQLEKPGRDAGGALLGTGPRREQTVAATRVQRRLEQRDGCLPLRGRSGRARPGCFGNHQARASGIRVRSPGRSPGPGRVPRCAVHG